MKKASLKEIFGFNKTDTIIVAPKYTTCVKADGTIDYNTDITMKSKLKARVDAAYSKLLLNNNLDPTLYTPIYQSEWSDDDFVNNQFTIAITAKRIDAIVEPAGNYRDEMQDIISQYITHRSDKMVVYTLPNSVHIDISKSIRQFKEQDIFSRVEAEYHAGRNSYQITTWLK